MPQSGAVASKHGRSWSTVGGGHPDFASGYWAAIAKLQSEHPVGTITILDWATFGFGIYGFDPRYRILVGRKGTESVVGVREMRSLRGAGRGLAEVEAILTNSTEDEVRAAFDIDF